jgi:molybdate transport system substrate-binding protein
VIAENQALTSNPSQLMTTEIKGISSMATRQVLADMAKLYEQESGQGVAIESVGGVTAAKRVQDGELFDVVILGSDALDRLIASGHIVPASKTGVVACGVSVAVRAGAPRPDISSVAALREAILAARSISYSTGPSGVALARLFEEWGIAEQIQSRIVTAPPSVPVGALVAKGEVELGFQQLSEMINLPGIDLLGPLPEAIQITTTFAAGLHVRSTQAEAVRAMLAFMTSPAVDEIKRRQGMEPV